MIANGVGDVSKFNVSESGRTADDRNIVIRYTDAPEFSEKALAKKPVSDLKFRVKGKIDVLKSFKMVVVVVDKTAQ